MSDLFTSSRDSADRPLLLESAHTEFAKVINCTRCNHDSCPKLLRDQGNNLPQPGYVGNRYHETRILLVGQNPGVSTKSLSEADRQYATALNQLGKTESKDGYKLLSSVLDQIIPMWPVHKTYFPLEECGLTLAEIAYCNVVRCRTRSNAAPCASVVRECLGSHFDRWLDWLNPKAVVFIGKWALNRGGDSVRSRAIPYDYINRDRSLNSTQRSGNRAEIVALIKSVTS